MFAHTDVIEIRKGGDMNLLLIRHGESEADILNVHEGRADFSLTEKGREQASKMANFVARYYSVDKIYSSPLKRALETAGFLARATGLEIVNAPDLMEFNNGLIAGLSREEAARKYPKQDLPIHLSTYEQESELEYRYRAEYILSEILSSNPDSSAIAIISHGGMINQLYHSFLRLPMRPGVSFPTSDTGIHEWSVCRHERRVLRANSTVHLLMSTK